MGLRALRLLPALATAGALAGCGTGNEPYTPGQTSSCQRKLGYRIRPPEPGDLIAGTAENGGLRARGLGNTLTIAFGVDARDALRLARAYRRRAASPGQRDLIQPKRNAVLVWTVAPPFAQLDAAQKCLR